MLQNTFWLVLAANDADGRALAAVDTTLRQGYAARGSPLAGARERVERPSEILVAE